MVWRWTLWVPWCLLEPSARRHLAGPANLAEVREDCRTYGGLRGLWGLSRTCSPGADGNKDKAVRAFSELGK